MEATRWPSASLPQRAPPGCPLPLLPLLHTGSSTGLEGKGAGRRRLFGLHDQHGKLFWGTPGRYMAKDMLRALTEELGREV